MKQRPPAWIFAVVPATLAAHALAYALTGRSQADAHHGYYLSLLQFSTIVLASICAVFVARSMTRIGWVAPLQQSLLAIFIRLSIAQIALFALLERLEGYVPAITGCATQIAFAFMAALAIQYFARFLFRCQKRASEAQVYLLRLFATARGMRISAGSFEPAYALRVRAWQSRFQRPPPQH